MECNDNQEELSEEVEFWLDYIDKWEASHNEAVPERVQLLLNNALLKLENHYSGKKTERCSHRVRVTRFIND